MDTIKNRTVALALAFGLLLVVVSGCTPAGPKALLRAQKLIEHGKYPQAIETLTNAAPLLSTNAHYWNFLGLALHYTGQASEAELAYNRALSIDRDLTEARYNLGCLWLEQNKPDLARTELTAFTLRRGNSPEGLLKLGAAQLGSREASAVAAAEKTFADALRFIPQSPEALNGMGLARYKQRRYGDAQQFFINALRLQPNYAPAILNLAVLSQQNFRDHQGALQKYRQYLALKPPPENAAAVAAVAHQLELDLSAAHAPPATQSHPPPAIVMTQAVSSALSNSVAQKRVTNPAPELAEKPKLAPTSPREKPATNPPRETVAKEKIQSNTVKTVPLAPAPQVHAEKISPETSAPPVEISSTRYKYKNPIKPPAGNRAEAQRLFAQGEQAQQAHRLADAVIAYRTATQLDPTYFEAHYNLGLAATEAGSLQTALTAYENALAIVPDSQDARYNFALVLKQAGFPADAGNELEKLLEKYPNEGRAHLALANLCAQQLHDFPRARQHYLRVLDTEPHHAQADAIRHWVAEHPL